MFTTCIFCHAHLGSNETIEAFPVGRRLAFDAAKGRLWVVCTGCERWNLTPLEERWEAVEECERRYRDSRLRVATDNIGLARVGDGVGLVRIGRPLRPEMAAWRYGDQFGRRRRKSALRAGGAVAAGATLLIGGPMVGVTMSGLLLAGQLASNVWAFTSRRRSVVLPHPDGGQLRVPLDLVARARIRPSPRDKEGWALEVLHLGRDTRERGGTRSHWLRDATPERATLTGAAAESAAARLLPRINRHGASGRLVQYAVRFLEEAGDPSAFFAHVAGRTREFGREQRWGDTGALSCLPPPVRLALEMAAHEDSERAALEGDLRELENAWRDAEEIAAIADSLLLPEGVAQRWRALGGGGRKAPG